MNIQTKELEGRPHFVVPMVMVVEGVLNGSNGPLLYPADELARSVIAWNGRPVVVDHPSLHGVSYAGDPVVFNRQKIGTVFNASMDGRRLKAEAWIDAERVAVVDRRVLDTIYNRQMMEVSTGLFTDNDEASGEFNGTRYLAVARNYRPDHLAVLPDKIGACSIADGAGLVRNEINVLDALVAPTW